MSGSTVSGAIADPGAGEPGSNAALPKLRGTRLSPLVVVVAAATLLALGLRLYQLTRPGFLLGVTEYDDGPYFGSALRMVNGSLPYRDFLLVQPPGITLLMIPAALLGKLTGTAWAMATGRILTTLAGAAAVVLAGLLVRHRGIFAIVVVCGISAAYPDSVQAARTVLVEPWLVLFCLVGALAVFEGDRLTTNWWRAAWGGAAFGFAGAVEVWAIIPVIVIAVLSLRSFQRLVAYLAGVAAGFLVPVVPFAALGLHQFYTGLVVAQVGGRSDATWVSIWVRLKDLTGLTDVATASHLMILAAAVLIAGFALGTLFLASLVTRRPPAALDVFAVVSAGLTIVAFMLPHQFHYHFGAFLAPFLAMAIGLPASRLLPDTKPTPDGSKTRPAILTWCAAGLAGLVIVGMAAVQANWESARPTKVRPAVVSAAQRLIPSGACVITDEVSFTIAVNRFISDVPGCPLLVDAIGTDLGLAHGRDPSTGAARYEKLVAVWSYSFHHAQYVWLSRLETHRVPWTPQLRAYFHDHFIRILSNGKASALYRRTGH